MLIPPPPTGKGRGRQVIAVARTADVVIMMLDATKGDVQRLDLLFACLLVSLSFRSKPKHSSVKISFIVNFRWMIH